MGARTRGIANQILSGGLDATDGLSGAVSSSNIANSSVTSVSSTPSIGGGFEKVASDPPSPTEGDIWFNTTSNNVKGYVFAPAGWSTAPNANTARNSGVGAGTQTAALWAAGLEPPNSTATEEYDGSSWTNGGSMSLARRALGGTGTQTAGLIATGYYADTGGPSSGSNATEEYNGTSWTNGGNINTTRYATGLGGTQTAGLATGGNVGSNSPGNYNEEYNGSSWTNTGSFPQGLRGVSSLSGTQTAMLWAGGATAIDNVRRDTVVEYDGSTWTTTTSLPETRIGHGMSGTQTSALIAYGSSPYAPGPGSYTSAFIFDGSTWTATGSTSNTGGGVGFANQGTTTASLATGTGSPAIQTEEFSGAGAQVKTLTSS
jgi:hypothetical protein